MGTLSALRENEILARKCRILCVFCGLAGNRVDGEGDKGDRVNPIPGWSNTSLTTMGVDGLLYKQKKPLLYELLLF